MNYALIRDGAVVGVVDRLPRSHAGISGFGLITDTETLAAHGFLPLVEVRPLAEPWQVLSGPVYEVGADSVTATWTAADRPIDEVRAEAKAELAKRRWTVEVAGVVVDGLPAVLGGPPVDGFQIATDRDSQAKITAAFVLATASPEFTTTWKGSDGSFRYIDTTNMISIGMTVASHVGGCFAEEARVSALITEASTGSEVYASLETAVF